MVVDDTTAIVMYMGLENGDELPRAEDLDKKGRADLLSKLKRVFSRTVAKVSMKSFAAGVHLVTDEGELVVIVCRNETFRGI